MISKSSISKGWFCNWVICSTGSIYDKSALRARFLTKYLLSKSIILGMTFYYMISKSILSTNGTKSWDAQKGQAASLGKGKTTSQLAADNHSSSSKRGCKHRQLDRRPSSSPEVLPNDRLQGFVQRTAKAADRAEQGDRHIQLAVFAKFRWTARHHHHRRGS